MADILEGLLGRPKQLQPLLNAHGETVREIRRDSRFSGDHKNSLIAGAQKDFDDQLKTFVLDFDQAISQKRVVLESLSNPPVERNGDAEAIPVGMENALQSEKALWRSIAEQKAILSAVLRNQQVALFRDDIELMAAAEIAKAFEDEATDPLFRESLAVYGVNRIKRLVRSDGGNVEPLQRINRAIAERKEALKTPVQKQAEADLTRLEKLSSRFHSNLGLLGKLRGDVK